MDREAIKKKAVNFWWKKHGGYLKEYIKHWGKDDYLGWSREDAVMLYLEDNRSAIANYFYPELIKKINMELEK